MNQWLFGYGSLIWRPDFDYVDRRPARLHGFSRRFWQGSHDHRGVPEAPGRVVTLVADPDGICDGVAYLVDAAVIEATFSRLDHREQNGYRRHPVRLEFTDGIDAQDGVVYIAEVGNFAYLGPAPLEEIASQIHGAEGPSGRNVDYLLDLARALRAQGAQDDHVFALESAVKELHP